MTLLIGEPHKKFSLYWPISGKKVAIDSVKLAPHWNYYVENDCFIGGAPLFSYLIQLDGTVIKRELGIQVKKHNPPISYQKEIYRNLRFVAITDKGRLRLGKHELLCSNGTLKLQSNNLASATVKSWTDSSFPGMFKFEDGSVIHHDRNGMLTLISSNKELPKIYIPCVLGSALAAATETTFTGDRYYRMEPKKELFFDDKNFMKIQAIKSVKNVLGLGLKEAKLSVDRGYVVTDSHSKLIQLQDELDQLSVDSTIRQRGIIQDVIKPGDFYQKYIQAFINQICSHGN